MLPLISKDEFPRRKRDSMLDFEVYRTQAERLLTRIPNAALRLNDPEWVTGKDAATLMRLTTARAECAIDLLSLSYSAGVDVESLHNFYPTVLDYFEEFALYSEAYGETPEGKERQAPHLFLGDFDFQYANRLLCFAILLGWPKYVPRVMAIIDYNNPTGDGLLERLAVRFMERLEPLPSECSRHLPYYKTLAIFDAPPAARPEMMREYLEDWYDASRREPYYGSHADGPYFLGYWSWEAAAVTAVLDIDDRTYRALQFYPRDMVAYAGQPERAGLHTANTFTNQLRVKGVISAYVPSRHVYCDYKSTGSYLLTMLRSEFDHPCLHSEAFDALIGELANDMARDCLAPLARHLAPAALQLWEIDFFEDTLYVAIVPEEAVAAFEQYWRVDYLSEPDAAHFAPRLRRIEPTRTNTGAGAKGARRTAAQPATTVRKRPRLDLLVDTASLPATPDLDAERSIALLRSPYSDHPDNGKFFDFSVWPPSLLALPAAAGDPQFARSWRPLYQYLFRNVWLCRDPADRRFRLAQIDDMDTWSPLWLGGGARLSGAVQDPKWIHDVMLHVSESTDERGKSVYEVVRVTKAACEVWYRSRRPLRAFPFEDAVRCVIVEDDGALALADGPVRASDFLRLPTPPHMGADGVIPLGGSSVAYSTHSGSALRMHRLDLATRERSTALLAGFGYRGKDRGQSCAGFGNLVVHKGHGDWWILNHKCNQFGEIDIALLWNATTDETIRIDQQDILLHQPTIVYQRSLDRYLAVAGNVVVLLCEFDALYAAKEKRRLLWEAAS